VTDFAAGDAGPITSSLRISRRLTTSTRTRYVMATPPRNTKYAPGSGTNPSVAASGVKGNITPISTTRTVVTANGRLGRLRQGEPTVLRRGGTRCRAPRLRGDRHTGTRNSPATPRCDVVEAGATNFNEREAHQERRTEGAGHRNETSPSLKCRLAGRCRRGSSAATPRDRKPCS
jgi:hypothetical protein